ncbi:MAG: hypothetical protein R3B09_20190 [Nannocystaceae bacterium]
MLADVVDRDDVGGEAGERGLADEAGAGLVAVFGSVDQVSSGRRSLSEDLAIELGVVGGADDPIPPALSSRTTT